MSSLINKSTKSDKINILIDNLIKKIIDLNNNNLEEKILLINQYIDNLVDYCIKRKIFYYIEKKIGYASIINDFKSYLTNYIQKLIDPDGSILIKYINENKEFDNFSDINSLFFNKFKNDNLKNQLKEVTFKDNCSLLGYDDNDGFESNYKSNYKSNQNFENNNFQNKEKDMTTDTTLALYIKILFNQNKYLLEFIDRLNKMCKIISDPTIKYKISNPFEHIKD